MLPGSESPVGGRRLQAASGCLPGYHPGFGSRPASGSPWVTWEASSARLRFPWQRQSPANPGLGSAGAAPPTGGWKGPWRTGGGGTGCRPGHASRPAESALAPAPAAAAAAPGHVGRRRPREADGGSRGGGLGRVLVGLPGPAGAAEGGRRPLQTLLGSLQLPRVARGIQAG